jgi:hypothetical protein
MWPEQFMALTTQQEPHTGKNGTLFILNSSYSVANAIAVHGTDV